MRKNNNRTLTWLICFLGLLLTYVFISPYTIMRLMWVNDITGRITDEVEFCGMGLGKAIVWESDELNAYEDSVERQGKDRLISANRGILFMKVWASSPSPASLQLKACTPEEVSIVANKIRGQNPDVARGIIVSSLDDFATDFIRK